MYNIFLGHEIRGFLVIKVVINKCAQVIHRIGSQFEVSLDEEHEQPSGCDI
jgi:hypothetical protein